MAGRPVPVCEHQKVYRVYSVKMFTESMCFTADILRTNTGVTIKWLHSIKCHSKSGQ